MINYNVRLLIVEDDKVDQMAMERWFKSGSGFYIYQFASSLAEAKAALISDKFDVVISDYALGDGTGQDLFEFTGGTPVIVITGNGDVETAVKMLRIGAYDYLTKDMNRDYLKMIDITVENVLKRKMSEDSKVHREKLQGVLEMAGAACHELNQPLQAISGYSELMMMEITEDNPAYTFAMEIKRETERLGNITRKLNSITRYETADYLEGRKIIDINRASEKANNTV